MPVQTDYALYTERGFKGQLVDEELHNVTTKIADVVIPYGTAVVRGSADNGVKIVTASTEEFVGIALRTLSGSPESDGAEQYEKKESANILDFGKVYVTCESGCVPGDKVYMRFAAGPGGTVIGALGNSADNDGTNDTAVLIPDATWESTATVGATAVVKLR